MLPSPDFASGILLIPPDRARRPPGFPHCDLPATSFRCYTMLSDQGKSGSDFKRGDQVREASLPGPLFLIKNGSGATIPPCPEVCLKGSGVLPRFSHFFTIHLV